MRKIRLRMVARHFPHVLPARHVCDPVHRHNRARLRQAALRCLPALPVANAQCFDGPQQPPAGPRCCRLCRCIRVEHSAGAAGSLEIDFQSGCSTKPQHWNGQGYLETRVDSPKMLTLQVDSWKVMVRVRMRLRVRTALSLR